MASYYIPTLVIGAYSTYTANASDSANVFLRLLNVYLRYKKYMAVFVNYEDVQRYMSYVII